MNKHAIILGTGSDIGSAIRDQLMGSGDWSSTTGRRHDEPLFYENDYLPAWDLLVCCYGKLDPIGSFWRAGDAEWDACIEANALLPLRQVRALYPYRKPGASVCFFSGAGSHGPAPSYSAYAASKVMLIKMTELLDDESPDCKFFILGPGVVRTKIHVQTLRACTRAANYARVGDFLDSGSEGTPMNDIYDCMMACVAAPKAVVGGRNVCVHVDDWRGFSALGQDSDPNMFKLRRVE